MLWTWCQSSTESLQAFGHCGNARKTLGTSNLDHRNPVVPVVLRMPQFLNGSKIFENGKRTSKVYTELSVLENFNNES